MNCIDVWRSEIASKSTLNWPVYKIRRCDWLRTCVMHICQTNCFETLNLIGCLQSIMAMAKTIWRMWRFREYQLHGKWGEVDKNDVKVWIALNNLNVIIARNNPKNVYNMVETWNKKFQPMFPKYTLMALEYFCSFREKKKGKIVFH